MSPSTLHADFAWIDGGWKPSETLRINVDGHLGSGAGDVEESARYVLPGMPNLHSHAFQRAMAGLAERRGPGEDSFWTWRETMYAFASRIGPQALRDIAAQLYVEMLEAGYTHVCEFHYLHHQPDGTPYDDAAEMSLALLEAARETGIGLTLLPVLYMTGGFDGRPLSARQRRFGHDVESYLRLLERLHAYEDGVTRVGIALHSLRAVPEAALREVLASGQAQRGPLHIHIAEQIGEVQDCLATRDARPVEWLLDHAEVDARWCLVHATHLDDEEVRRLAATGAVAGLCPTTEANLGDGLFRLTDWLKAGGRFGIGSDSHVSVSPVEELRWLEYGQRLQTHHRCVVAEGPGASVGTMLWQAALDGGAQASGAAIGALGAGRRADLIVLDDRSAQFAAREPEQVIDSFIFAGNRPLVRDVMVAGQWRVREGRHVDGERIATRYRATVERLALG